MRTLSIVEYNRAVQECADRLMFLSPMEQLGWAAGYARMLQRDVGLHGDDAAAVVVTALLRVREVAREPVR